jgi:hypothetical protein
MVPQIEEMPPQKVLVFEPSDCYVVAQTKTEKPAPRRRANVVRARPNFFEKLVAGFIKVVKHQAWKSVGKLSRADSSHA